MEGTFLLLSHQLVNLLEKISQFSLRAVIKNKFVVYFLVMLISRKYEENYFKLCTFNKILSFSANVLNVKKKLFLTFEIIIIQVRNVSFTVSGFYKIAFKKLNIFGVQNSD